MFTLIVAVIVIGVLVFVHELGHFALAKWNRVRVEKFSLGFGPKLLGITRGGTEYLISAVPLGGYVKMAGEEPGEEKTGAKGKSVSPWVVELLAKVAKGEKVAVAPAVWEKGNGKARRAFKADAANAGHVLRAKAFKNGSAIVAYVVTRELDV